VVSPGDRTILRDLAKKLADIAGRPEMAVRRELWYRHNRLEKTRPLVLVFPEGSWDELLPGSVLQCESKWARDKEWRLRQRIYEQEHFRHDIVTEKNWVVHKMTGDDGWGIADRNTSSGQSKGAYHIEQVLRDRDDFKKLRHPRVRYDEAATNSELAACQDLFGDILSVELKGVDLVAFHFMSLYQHWRGIEQTNLDFCMDPEFMHEILNFIKEGYESLLRQWEQMGLLTVNNREEYHSSGGTCYSTELPAAGFDHARVRPVDMWGSAESQEMATVGPQMHEEFPWKYERQLLERFGLAGYGCCEDLTHKLDFILALPNMRRVSISPWADVDACAQKMGNRAIFSWKPHPAHLVGEFDEKRIRKYIRHAIEATRGCVLEIILKDTDTCENRPERFTRWSEIAMELAQDHGA